MKRLAWAIVLVLGWAGTSRAYTTVVAASSAPVGIEQSLICLATTYLNVNLLVNPLVPNVYQMTLEGFNPDYIPPTKVTVDTTTWFNNISAMQQLLPAISSDSYTNGWANGEVQERFRDIGFLNTFFADCQSTSTFLTRGSTFTTVAVDSTTCENVLGTATQFIFQQTYSTYPAILNGY